jgi:hypothetical protein
MQVKHFVQKSCLNTEVHVGRMLSSPISVCFIRYVNLFDQSPEIDWKMSPAADVPGQKHKYINPLVPPL